MQTRPGELTTFETIPLAMRAHAQFILYRTIAHNGKLLKLPYSAHKPQDGSIDPLNPTHWTTFEHAVSVCLQYVSGGYGIGFVLTQEAGITCFDLDNREDPAAYESAVAAMSVEPHKTWCETSVSGNGRHYFYLGNTPDGTSSMNDVHPGIEIYCSKRFIALTGNLLPESLADLTDGEGIVSSIYLIREERRKERIAAAGTSPLSGVTYELGRGHMSNERALLLMSERKPLSYGHLWQAAPQGTGSERIMQVVGDLDKILADPEQVYQIIESSPLGQSRCNSLYRKFYKYWLPDARKSNDQGIWNRTQEEQAYLLERGREMALAFDAREKAEREAQYQQDIANTAAVIADIAEDDRPRFSDGVTQAVTYITEGMDRRYLAKDVLPPGPFGQLVLHVESTAFMSLRKLVLPPVLAVMSALVGRHAKLPETGSGLNVFILIGAKTGTGKSAALDAIEDTINSLYIPRDGAEPLDVPTYCRQMEGATRQGIHSYFQRQPSLCWTSHECSKILEQATRSNDQSAALDLSNVINFLYDASRRYTKYSPPASMRAKNDGDGAIMNANISLCWATTMSNLRKIMTRDMIETGLATRMLIVMHDKAGGRIREGAPPALPQGLYDLLRQIIAKDNMLRDLYAQAINPETKEANAPPASELDKLITTIKITPEARALYKTMEKRILGIVDDINNERSSYSETFRAFNRVSSTALRIAGVLAYVNHPINPTIDTETLSWAYGYALQLAGELVTAIDRGDLAAEFGDEERVFMDIVRKTLSKQPKSEPWVRSDVVRNWVKQRTPFKGRDWSRMVETTVKHLIAMGILIEEDMPRPEGARGPAARIFKCTDHPAWSEQH